MTSGAVQITVELVEDVIDPGAYVRGMDMVLRLRPVGTLGRDGTLARLSSTSWAAVPGAGAQPSGLDDMPDEPAILVAAHAAGRAVEGIASAEHTRKVQAICFPAGLVGWRIQIWGRSPCSPTRTM